MKGHSRIKEETKFLFPSLAACMSDAAMSETDIQHTAKVLDLVNFPDRAGLFKSIQEHWQRSQGFALATLNLDHIVKMRGNPDFFQSYKAHSHIVADGNPIVWLSRMAGREVDLMPGSELIEPLAEMAARDNVPVAFLGATPETLDRAAQRLTIQYPGLRVVEQIAPPFGFDPQGVKAVSYLEAIRQSGAQLCFLALGAPKQEQLAIEGRRHAPGCGFVSIGAGLDFIAGSQTRAPKWVRTLALEWVWRMLRNPKRLAGRYWQCILILPGLVREARRIGRQN
ncbi:WecB/TagA/CpsF family glycosyltransferase [Ruegeria sp. SCSIO 43209]|uniref:WecB/TagA/CpsF family glycosyltransferase n=1 Tax=Ruegeria sp. SCSIO 43209 TaxID=2793010 RepID=UPI0021059709|nr:WecB/TagA/CpsF family glycosyltransferase [Ruegeria sp. SCSIO 43209]